MTDRQYTFGREILGPIFYEFAYRLWIYLSAVRDPENTVVMFCARGGFGLFEIYNEFLRSNQLSSPVAFDRFMVSRLVAVRPALLKKCESAYRQIGYEFDGKPLHSVMEALSFGSINLTYNCHDLNQHYSPAALDAILNGAHHSEAWEFMQRQSNLFAEYLSHKAQRRDSIILVDTGLYGGTLDMLREAFPSYNWSLLLLARSNYRKQVADHFHHTLGILLEEDMYNPFNKRSVLLRYWQLIESILEPDLPSVTTFDRQGETIVSNLERSGWQDNIAARESGFLAGILHYIGSKQSLPTGGVSADSRRSWERLNRAIIWPHRDDGRVLDAGYRSGDFGRTSQSSSARTWRGPIRALRGKSMWREGEIALSGTGLRLPLLTAIQAAYILRWLKNASMRKLKVK